MRVARSKDRIAGEYDYAGMIGEFIDIDGLPAIDSLRERHVMSLKTRFGGLANKGLVLESPVLTNNDWARLKAHFGSQAAEIDCTFPAGGDAATLRATIVDIRAKAEQAVHTHLVRKGLRSYASVNIRTAECLDTHYYAVLIGVGATTVNAYLAKAAIADRHAHSLFGDLTLAKCLKNYRKAIQEGLLKIISKMGIAVISSYHDGYNFEAVELSRALANDFFPGMPAKISGEGYESLNYSAQERHEQAFDHGITASRRCRSATSTASAMAVRPMPIRRS